MDLGDVVLAVGQGAQEGPHAVQGAPLVGPRDDDLDLSGQGQGTQAEALRSRVPGVRGGQAGPLQEGPQGAVPGGPAEEEGAVEPPHGLPCLPPRRGELEEVQGDAAAPPHAVDEEPEIAVLVIAGRAGRSSSRGRHVSAAPRV